MLNQKGVIHLLIPLLLLLAGIVAGVFLVSKTQIFKPKASSKYIEIQSAGGKDAQGNACVVQERQSDGKLSTNCPAVKLNFTSPLETISDAGLKLIKTAYAANSPGGAGYSCNKTGGDRSKIFHQECNFVLLGINFCDLKFPGTSYETKEQRCDIGLRCEDSTTDLFKPSAKCVPSDEPVGNPSQTNFQNNTFQPPPPSDTSSFTPESSSPPGPESAPFTIPADTPQTANVTPAPPTPGRTTATPNQTSSSNTSPDSIEASNNSGGTNNNSTGTGSTAPNTGAGSTAPNTGVGPTAPNTGTGVTDRPSVRTTKKYRFAENPNFLDEAGKPVEWKTYRSGGVSEIYTFKNPNPSQILFIYAQFMDDQGETIKFPSGNDFTSASITYSVPSSPTAPATPVPTATPRPSVSPTASPTIRPTASPTQAPAPTAAPTACDLHGDIANWKNCTKDGLKLILQNLPQQTRNLLPNEALLIFNEAELIQLFPPSQTSRLALLPSSALVSFSNSDLLAIADSTGNRVAFLSTFSCDRIVKFSLDIQQGLGCGSTSTGTSGGGSSAPTSVDNDFSGFNSPPE